MSDNLIKKSTYKRYVLNRAKVKRAHPFNRVHDMNYERAETALRLWIDNMLHETPSRGKTIK